MSTQTRELIEICEQLPEAKQEEVKDFARFLLSRNGNQPSSQATERWLSGARGAAAPGVTTDQVIGLTRGET